MKNIELAIDTVKESVTALEAAEALGLEPDRHGRCRCPFHNGNDRNLKLYGGSRGYYCFVCHAHGDVITLAKRCLDGTFTDALKWLCETFALNVDIDAPMDAERARKAAEAAQRRKEERQREAELEKSNYEMYLAAGDLVREAEERVKQYAPKTPDETASPVFRQALAELEEAKELARSMSLMVFRGGM